LTDVFGIKRTFSHTPPIQLWSLLVACLW